VGGKDRFSRFLDFGLSGPLWKLCGAEGEELFEHLCVEGTMEFFNDPIFCGLYRDEIRMIVNVGQIIRDLESIPVRTVSVEDAIVHFKRLRVRMYAATQACYLVYRDLAGRRVRY